MSEEALTHFLAQYGPLAVVSLIPFRIGMILGRRWVQKDRPRWAPHLPPLPVVRPTPLSVLFDVAAYVGMAVLTVAMIFFLLGDGLKGKGLEDTTALLAWLAVCGVIGYGSATNTHEKDVHRYRYTTDPVYRADYDRREWEDQQEEEEERERDNAGAMGEEPYKTWYGYWLSR